MPACSCGGDDAADDDVDGGVSTAHCTYEALQPNAHVGTAVTPGTLEAGAGEVLMDIPVGTGMGGYTGRANFLGSFDPVDNRQIAIAREWQAGPLRDFFLEEAALSIGNRFGNIDTIDDNIDDAVDTLEANCASGELRLDLDLAAHIGGSSAAADCGSIFDPATGAIIVE